MQITDFKNISAICFLRYLPLQTSKLCDLGLFSVFSIILSELLIFSAMKLTAATCENKYSYFLSAYELEAPLK